MDEKPKTWAVSLQDVVSVHVMTSMPIDVRFPDCDFLVRLDPPRRWKRGQKLNRGGRCRARAKHAAKQQETFDEAVRERVTAPGGMNPPAFGSDEAWALLDEIRQRILDSPKAPYPEAAALAGFGKDGEQ